MDFFALLSAGAYRVLVAPLGRTFPAARMLEQAKVQPTSNGCSPIENLLVSLLWAFKPYQL